MDKIRWGIISTGMIAKQFAEDLPYVEGAELVAVGSRSQDSADAFAKTYGIPKAHPNYEALANDPDVDVVYIATPHPFHEENALMCLEAGKAVLCEKPFALNATQTQNIIAKALDKGCFLMEAMWTRFLPHMRKLHQLIDEGAIGEVQLLSADFGFAAPYDPAHRLFNLELGGGALLDVGIYPLSLASWLLGIPDQQRSVMKKAGTGVDEMFSIILEHSSAAQSRISASLSVQTPQTLTLAGSEGHIQVSAPWWGIPRDSSHQKHTLTLTRTVQSNVPTAGNIEVIDVPHSGHGYQYEAAEVGRCLQEGLLESPVITLDESLNIMRLLDSIRSDWRLVYPQEK